MQDRFLFRIWDKESKEYHNGMEVFDYMRGLLNPQKYILEQCTGLKDRNGKLIYEGDIVKVIYNEELNTLSKQIYPMLFNDKVAKFGFKHPDGHFFYFTNDEDFSYEVIGNIHENPDLLENKDE